MVFCRKQKEHLIRIYFKEPKLLRKDMTNRSKTDIKRVTRLLCVLFVVASLQSGCSWFNGAPGETKAEVQERHKVIVKTQKQQIQDDWDAVLLLNKSSRLSDKYVR